MSIDDQDLLFIDVETTGLSVGYHEMIDFHAIRYDGHDCTHFGRKLMPQHPDRISEIAQKINGFSVDKWKADGAVDSSATAWNEFNEFAKGALPVAHNPSFDRGFVMHELNKYDIRQAFDYHWIGTESIAYTLFYPNVDVISSKGLEKLFEMEPEDYPHTARSGAERCLQLYFLLMSVRDAKLPRSIYEEDDEINVGDLVSVLFERSITSEGGVIGIPKARVIGIPDDFHTDWRLRTDDGILHYVRHYMYITKMGETHNVKKQTD